MTPWRRLRRWWDPDLGPLLSDDDRRLLVAAKEGDVEGTAYLTTIYARHPSERLLAATDALLLSSTSSWRHTAWLDGILTEEVATRLLRAHARAIRRGLT